MFWNSKEVSKHSEVLLNDLIIVEQKAVKWEFFIPKQGTSSLDAVIFFFFPPYFILGRAYCQRELGTLKNEGEIQPVLSREKKIISVWN